MGSRICYDFHTNLRPTIEAHEGLLANFGLHWPSWVPCRPQPRLVWVTIVDGRLLVDMDHPELLLLHIVLRAVTIDEVEFLIPFVFRSHPRVCPLHGS